MPIRVFSHRSVPSEERLVAVPASPAAANGPLPLGLPLPEKDTVQKPAGISLCMIVKNEERFLAQCLESARPIVDEIIVVDTGSTDATMDIARRFGATVIERAWRNDFAWARNQAIDAATKRWILILDADEELLPESFAALEELKTTPAATTGIWLRCFNEADDYQGTGAMSHLLVRIFPNRDDIRFKGLIHEYVSLGGSTSGIKAVHSPVAIRHHGYLRDVVSGRDKGKRNFEIVKRAVEEEPNEPFHWFNYGTTAFLLGDYDEAKRGLEKMREINGAQPRGFMPNGLSALADVYTDKFKDPVSGEAAARQCLEFSPRYANAHFALGKALVMQGRLEDARMAFKMAIDDKPYNHMQFVVDDQVSEWKAHSEIGATYVQEGNDVEALRWFDAGLKNLPTALPLRMNRARALERLGRYEDAKAAFESSYRDLPQDLTAIDFINYLLRLNRYDDALLAVEDAITKVSPGAKLPVLQAAIAAAQRKGPESYERYLRFAAAHLPGAAEIVAPLEELLANTGRSHEIPALVAAEEAAPAVASIDFERRARHAMQRGDYAQALVFAERGLEGDPAHGNLNFCAGIASANLGQRERALDFALKVPREPQEAYVSAQLLVATVQRERGDTAATLEALSNVVAAAPERLDVWTTLASLSESVGDLARAESALRRAFDLDRRAGAAELAGFYLRQQRFEEAKTIAEAGIAS